MIHSKQGQREPPPYGAYLIGNNQKAVMAYGSVKNNIVFLLRTGGGMRVGDLRARWRDGLGIIAPPLPSVRRSLLELLKEGIVYRAGKPPCYTLVEPEVKFWQAWFRLNREENFTPQMYLSLLSIEDLDEIEAAFDASEESVEFEAALILILAILGEEVPEASFTSEEIGHWSQLFRTSVACEMSVREKQGEFECMQDPNGFILTGATAYRALQ